MKLNTKVVEGRWDEEDGVWNITLENQKDKGRWKDWAHVFINGTGSSYCGHYKDALLTSSRHSKQLEVARY
jgi:hypothetical protein